MPAERDPMFGYDGEERSAEKPAHTPLPWEWFTHRSGDVRISVPGQHDSVTVATMGRWQAEHATEQRANADLIVRACNSHAALVEASEAAEMLDGHVATCPLCDSELHGELSLHYFNPASHRPPCELGSQLAIGARSKREAALRSVRPEVERGE